MSNTIDIMCAVDTDTILSKYTRSMDSTKPTMIDSKLVYMIVKQGSALTGNGTGDLEVGASIGDNLRWREESLSANFENSVMFYQFVTSAAKGLITLPPQLVGGIQEDGGISKVDEAQPVHAAKTPPWLPKKVETPFHFWQSTAEGKGRVTYHWNFLIADRDGNVLGYYQWDPWITIK